VAIASWADTTANVKLIINWKALGINPKRAVIVAPAMKNFQPGRVFKVGEAIPVEKGKGWLLEIRERK
jgi:hypothetical protein